MEIDLRKIQRSKSGFSLIELSIVLVISGIMIYGTLSLYVVSAEKAKLDSTDAKLTSIVSALRLYYQTVGDLPCPADGTLALTDNNFGLGSESPEGTCTVAEATVSGVVPTRALNLPDNYMFDAWGNRITYVVDDNCVNATALAWDDESAGGTDCVDASNVIIQDNSGDSVRTSVAAYVLISHGKNGLGARNRNGGANTAATATDETQNTDGDLTFKDDFIRDWTGATNYFDDMVRWKLPAQISYVD